MIGFPVNKADVDGAVGRLSANLRNVFSEVGTIKSWLDSNDDNALGVLGYTPADITALKAVMIDLTNMVDTVYGRRAQTPASNFMFNAAKTTGLS